MKKTLILPLLALAALVSCGKTGHMSEKMVYSQMSRCPEATYLDYAGGKLKWSYTPGLELKAFLDVYERYGGKEIYDYVLKWYDAIVDADGSIKTYSVEKYNVDLICPGKSLFYFYDKTGEEKYRKAIELIKTQIDAQPRTSEGAFWHKKIYPHQIWLDGVYMAEPFYAEYASRYLEGEERLEAYREIVNEFVIAAEHTYDPATKLYRHAWDESRSMFWCDPQTGQSQHCWGRALGWYCMAIVDVLDFLPQDFAGRGQLIDLLRSICAELPKWADPESGVWYQVLDQPGREGNYLEATCSAMFSYTFLKGVRMGYLDAELLPYAQKLYADLVKEFVSADEQGRISLEKCCSVGGLGGSNMRMGDYAYYLSEPVRPNDSKGVGPFIWASLEMERIK